MTVRLVPMAVDEGLTTTEAARRLGIEPEDVYELVFSGKLEGRPGADGVVRISESAVLAFLDREAHV
jgi:excisionase family DNA binding protein